MIRHSDAVHAGVLWPYEASQTAWIPLSTIGPSQFLHKNAMSVHERKVPELPSCSHAVPSVNIAPVCSSPAASWARKISKSSTKAGRSAGAVAVAHPLHGDWVGRADLNAR